MYCSLVLRFKTTYWRKHASLSNKHLWAKSRFVNLKNSNINNHLQNRRVVWPLTSVISHRDTLSTSIADVTAVFLASMSLHVYQTRTVSNEIHGSDRGDLSLSLRIKTGAQSRCAIAFICVAVFRGCRLQRTNRDLRLEIKWLTPRGRHEYYAFVIDAPIEWSRL